MVTLMKFYCLMRALRRIALMFAGDISAKVINLLALVRRVGGRTVVSA